MQYTLYLLLLFHICFAFNNPNDQAELNRRVQEGQAQALDMAKQMAEVQKNTQIEIEKAKIQAQMDAKRQENSPLMNSSQKDFTSSTVINPKNEVKYRTINSRNVAKSKLPTQYGANVKTKPYSLPTNNGKELSDKEIELLLNAYKTQNLQSLQEAFFKYDFNTNANLMEALEQKEHTIKIRTRYAMTTTIIFDFPIENYVLGDNTGFEVNELPNMDNALNVRPLLIGIDTNLTVFTKDKRIYSIYLFSTDHKSNNTPQFIVNVKTPYTKEEIEKMANLRNHKQETIDNTIYLVIGEGKERIKIKREDIDRRYIQKAKKKHKFLLARNIFSDKQFTFFEYDKDLMPEMPAVWVVIDGKDSPVSSRIIGNYLVAESIADKFTLRIGDSYVCVRKKKD